MPDEGERYDWKDVRSADLSLNQSVDGDKIFNTNYWHGGRQLSCYVGGSIVDGQKALLSRQMKRSITLERVFRRWMERSQVPYRKLIDSLFTSLH